MRRLFVEFGGISFRVVVKSGVTEIPLRFNDVAVFLTELTESDTKVGLKTKRETPL